MKAMNFIKGMGAGLVVGAAVGMLAVPKKHKCKTGVARAIQSACEVLDGVCLTMGL